MKGLGKPISSPGRTEKLFPPPLMRFLKSNVGSKSSRRTRASPMFMRNKNKNNKNVVGLETTQEPSSPKVTCIGQVRGTRRSSSTRKKNQQKKQKKPCCCNFQWKLNKPKSLFSSLKKLVCCFRFGYCRKRVETVDSLSRVESTQRVQTRVSTSSVTTIESIEDVVVTTTIAKTEDEEGFVGPPKNALLLTRCRSAPYRSSSLASRFWDSPLNNSLDYTECQRPQNNFQEPEEMSLASTFCGSPLNSLDTKSQRPQNNVQESKEKSLASRILDTESQMPQNNVQEAKEKLLASRFWGSQLNSLDTESQRPQNNVQEPEEKPVLENPNPISPKGENGDLEWRKSHESEKMQSSINGESSKEEENGGAYVHPLLLTRCKSEPARTGERLNPTRFCEPDPQS
ncbi:uncharacterized protein LOC132057262 [Lycium ferocissimum]|uniref:uncharacterized protein LOC132057262 n=1 Tax=Lycium ferocissimum TaxID=112874 RepID=UPI00281698FD|nr:uncharacterized protein LOC132057262 [Lycium ferocissimum]